MIFVIFLDDLSLSESYTSARFLFSGELLGAVFCSCFSLFSGRGQDLCVGRCQTPGGWWLFAVRFQYTLPRYLLLGLWLLLGRLRLFLISYTRGGAPQRLVCLLQKLCPALQTGGLTRGR